VPRVRVIADDGWVALDEHTCARQLASDHYLQCLADRIRWAVADAETEPRPLAARSPGDVALEGGGELSQRSALDLANALPTDPEPLAEVA
jgi:hypothetical protein